MTIKFAAMQPRKSLSDIVWNGLSALLGIDRPTTYRLVCTFNQSSKKASLKALAES